MIPHNRHHTSQPCITITGTVHRLGCYFPPSYGQATGQRKALTMLLPVSLTNACSQLVQNLFLTCSEFVYKFLMTCSGLVHVHHLTASLELLYLPCFCQTLIMELTLFSPCHKKNKINQAAIFPINPRTLFVGNSQSHRISWRIWDKCLKNLMNIVFKVHLKVYKWKISTTILNLQMFQG